MSTSLTGQPAARSSALDSAAVRALLAGLALAAGLVVAWLARGSMLMLSVLAVPLAAANGYSKAYSP